MIKDLNINNWWVLGSGVKLGGEGQGSKGNLYRLQVSDFY